MNDHIKRHNDNILTRMRGMEAQPVSGMIDPKNPTNGPGSAPTHTPAAQPAGEMDDAALVEAMARALCVHDGVDPESFIYNCETCTVPAWRHYVDEARVSLAVACPVLQDQARREALDEAAVDGEALMDTGRKLERAKIVAYLDNKLQRMGLAHEGYNYVEAVRNHIKDTMP